MGLRNLKVGDVLKAVANKRAVCRLVDRDDVGWMVEVFPYGQGISDLPASKAIAVMRVNSASLRLDFERVAQPMDRPLPHVKRALSGIYLAADVVAVAQRKRRQSLLQFTPGRRLPPSGVKRRAK